MNHKKSCGNCWHGRDGVRPSQVPCPRVKCDVCAKWLRNPAMWLSILPTEPGVYWHRDKNKKTKLIAVDKMNDVYVTGSECSCDINELEGEWQGPITPRRINDQ